MAVEALQAAHVGLTARGLLQAGATFRLRAVFSRAAHAVAPGGELLVLTGDDLAAPWALGVPGLPWPALAHGPQARLIVSAGSPTCLRLAGLTIKLESPRVWASPSPCPVAPPEARRAALRAAALPEAAPGLAAHSAEPLVARLGAALAAGDIVALAGACEPLVGLGRGLTPAGDDLLTGALGVAALAGRPCRLPPLGGRTTLPGATQIAHAAAGALIEPLHHVISALLAGEPAPPASHRRLLGLGHSSGADMLVGVRLALAALSGRPPAC